MRILMSVSLFSLMASGALADQFTLDSTVNAVTVYGQGATITRTMSYDLPAGQHTLNIVDIPYEFNAETLQIKGGEGLVIHASRIVSQRPALAGPQIKRRDALNAQIETLDAQIRQKQQESAAAGLVINAASARIKLLESLGTQQAESAAGALEAQTVSTQTLSDLVALVGNETLRALQDAQAAREQIATLNREMQDLVKQRDKAREELAQLVEPSDWSSGVSLQVSAETAVAGVLQISYVVENASWHPVYRFMLDTGSESMTVNRSVTLSQGTTENWDSATISVSTATPFAYGRFYMPDSNIARYAPKPLPVDSLRMADGTGAVALAAPQVMALAEPARMANAEINFQGITARYTLPAGTVVSGNAEDTTVALSETAFDIDLSARASIGDSAYVVAEWKNQSDEPYLPGIATFFRDGAFVSSSQIELVAAGATTPLGFGRIDGLQVKRTILRREDGSSGVLSTANDRVVDYELSVENVSQRAWDIVLYDRVPVSEQEDLVVDWSARPRPTQTDVEGRRGVLAWGFTLEGGDKKTIRLSYELQWPEGNLLQMQP